MKPLPNILSLLTIVANKQTFQIWANPKILPETNPNTCPDIGRGVQGRRRTQLRRPLELKAGPEQWNVAAANYFIWRESYQGPTKYWSKDCCYRRNLFTTNFRNAKLIWIERKSKGWHLLLPEYVSVCSIFIYRVLVSWTRLLSWCFHIWIKREK